MKIKFVTLCVLILFSVMVKSQTVTVDVNLNVNHQLGMVDEFERSKFVTIHADVLSSDWDLAPNSIADTRDAFLNGYNVYMGRNTGPVTGDLKGAKEDPSRPGFVDPSYYVDRKDFWKNYYGSQTSWHQYDNRNNLILCPQLHPFWPDGTALTGGWALSTADTPTEPFGTASGDFLANYVKNIFGTGGSDGQKKPHLIEIINEPMFELVDWKGVSTPNKIFKFHQTVAKQVKALNADVKIGGYVTAFPEFDKNNFQQWDKRWKSFIDIGGNDIDFYSLHFYDMPVFGGKKILRKGGDIEASFDMLEHYSYLKFGQPKHFVISEYGATVHDLQGPWSSYRDWLRIKATNSMMLQFMERANLIEQTINFTMLKVDWWSPANNGTANHTWPDRLFRKSNEPASYTGNWVYTDMIHYYDLWQDVKGKRADSWSSDLDVMVDSYVNGNKAYVIVNNLAFEDKTLDLVIKEDNGLSLEGLKIKKIFLSDNNPVLRQNTVQLDTENYNSDYPTTVLLKPEATYILEYTYTSDINQNYTSNELKYYADKFKQPIIKGATNSFAINEVSKGTFGEATLRIGVGRNHGLSLKPTVRVNGTALTVPTNLRGDSQVDRHAYFGVIEINVPYDLLKVDNTVDVVFDDDGGFISSVALQAYSFNREITRGGENPNPDPIVEASIAVDDVKKYKTTNYISNETLDVMLSYNAGTGNTVTNINGGVQVKLREITSDSLTVVNDYTVSDSSTIGQQSGEAQLSIDLTGVKPSEELPEGNFYLLLPIFHNGIGNIIQNGLKPINIVSNNDTLSDNLFREEEFSIYLNQAKNELIIKGTESFIYANIYGLSGRLLTSVSIDGNSVNIANIKQSGIYLLELIGYNNRKVEKVLVLKNSN